MSIEHNDYITLQELYNNLAYNVPVSEIYIIPADFNPEKIDALTGKPEEPILMFDELIMGRTADDELVIKRKSSSTTTDKVEEIEIFEYRTIYQHLAWIKEHNPYRSTIKNLDFPAISGKEIITCDNSRFSLLNPDDKDRSGIVYSVPFYDLNGNLKGLISAIFLSQSLRDLLHSSNYAIYNTHNNYQVLPHEEGQANKSIEWINNKFSDPDLIFSKTLPLNIIDGESQWFLWAGLPNKKFLNSRDIKTIKSYRIVGYTTSILIALAGFIFISSMKQSQEKIADAKDKADKANKAKSEFLARMSHEIRTPMNGIIGTASLLIDTNLDKKQKSYVDTISKSGDNLLVILNEILDFSKVEAGEISLSLAPFNLHEATEGIKDLFAPLALEKNIALKLNYDKTAPQFIIGDVSRFRQVLTNLLNNALKFTDHGSITVDVEVESHTEEESILRFSITDSGKGIPEAEQGGMFKPFTQSNSQPSRFKTGTGLGLSICKSLVEIMGGDIGLVSEYGKGSCFWFRLHFPVATEEDIKLIIEEKDDIKEIVKAPKLNLKILLAEDIVTNQFIMTEMLESFGCQVDIAFNGKEAVQMSENTAYDLILMDIQMPVMDGFEAVKAIRERNRDYDINVPIIALTANALSEEKDKCIDAGMNDFIPKPIKKPEFIQALQKWCKHH